MSHLLNAARRALLRFWRFISDSDPSFAELYGAQWAQARQARRDAAVAADPVALFPHGLEPEEAAQRARK